MKNRTTSPRRHVLACAVSLTSLSCSLALAQEQEHGVRYAFSGYGTLAGAAHTGPSDMEFRSSLNQSIGAKSMLDLGVDSRIGVQGVADFGSGFSVTGQLLGQRLRIDKKAAEGDEFDIGAEWLFAQYSPSRQLDFRVGRVVLPAFMVSDSRNVSYAQPWLRAPLEVYAVMPLTHLDGVQALWRIPIGSSIFTIQPSYGQSEFNISALNLPLAAKAKKVSSLNLIFESGDWLFRYGQVKNTSNLEIPFAGNDFESAPYKMKDMFTSIGAQFDNGSAVVMAEMAQRRQNDMPIDSPASYAGIPVDDAGTTLADVYAQQFSGQPLAKSRSWYVAAGWRFGTILPMLSVGAQKDQKTGVVTRNVNASVRYDLKTGVALKAQLGQYQRNDDVAFVTPVADDYRKIRVLTVGVDFVF